jgi:tetratricopeptide (TPR) repeat protein
MKSILAAGLAVAVALGASGVGEAAQPRIDYRVGTPGGAAARPPAPTPQPAPAPPAATRPPAPQPTPSVPRVATQNIVVYPNNWYNNSYPSYYNPNYYDSYGYGGYSPYYSPYYSRYYAPPVFVPAGTLYGPGPILNMMGVAHWFQGGTAAPAAVEHPAPRVVAKPANLKRGKDDDDAAAAAAAQRYIGVGDTQFAKQKYSEANDRYRRAVRTSPQLADAWFRQGFALAGMGHYDMAATSLRRGLELKPDWPKSEFRLAALFGGDEAAKTAFLEGLAAAAEARPNNVDLLFLLGVCQHFDGQADRAATFLKRANELAPGDKAHLQAFLN